MKSIERAVNNEKPREEKNYSVEVLQRFSSKIEEKHINSILECLDRTLKNAELIGEGKNAEVFKLEKPWTSICVKVFKKEREVINDFEQEFEFQKMVNDLGIRTPENLLSIENKTTKQQYLLMERIKGLSLKDLALGKNKKKLSELVNNKETFFKELETNITKMHQDNIHHRDLHSGNVMYDFKTKQPVIIDFGHATKAWSSDEDKDIYIGDGYIKDEVTKRSVFKKIIFSKDMDKLKELKKDF
jgi:tRNA A-37 threonylcarbamoyl transferase component Bud32